MPRTVSNGQAMLSSQGRPSPSVEASAHVSTVHLPENSPKADVLWN